MLSDCHNLGVDERTVKSLIGEQFWHSPQERGRRIVYASY